MDINKIKQLIADYDKRKAEFDAFAFGTKENNYTPKLSWSSPDTTSQAISFVTKNMHKEFLAKLENLCRE